jgi:RNase H-fold protein (predicted Holliday junction resolvase)
MLIESGMRRDKRRTVIDKLAATLILQSYMDRVRPREEQ